MSFRRIALAVTLTSSPVLLAIAATTNGFAQTSYGAIAGVIADQSGAAVSRATVTVVSNQTGETRAVTTSTTGAYQIQGLGTGTYTVTVEAPSFAKTVVSGISVEPSTTTSVNPQLSVGSTSEVVSVSSATELVQTETGEISTTLNSREITQLPVSSLNAYNLISTNAGVLPVTVGTGGNGSKFSVNGSRPRANNYLIEGQDNNDAGLTGQGLQPSNQEAVDSVTFLLNSYAPEFGYAGGGVSNLVYKSGTNQYHGAIWDRVLNSSLDATDHNTVYNGGLKSKYRENIYGFRAGGPILHDKLFLFASMQWDKYRSSSQLSTLVVPTAAGYSVLNNYKSNPRVANLLKAYNGLTADPTKFTNVLRNIDLGPDPTTGVARGIVQYGGYQRTAPNGSDSSELVLKSDYLISDKDKLQLRFVRSVSNIPYDTGNFPAQLPFFDTNQGGPAYNSGLTENHLFSPKAFNEFRLSYSRIAYTFDLRPDTYSNPLALGPTVSIASVQGYGIPTSVPQGRAHNTYTIQDAFTYQKGNHALKVGVDLDQIRVRDAVPFVFYGSINYAANTSGAVQYSGLANYIDDYSGFTSSTGSAVSQQFGSNVARPKLTQQNYYVQDHWKVTPRLALDYGVRYEYTGAPFNYLPFPAVDFANPSQFGVSVKQNPQYTNIAPRFGFNYSPRADSDLSIRGGFGIFYDHLFTNIVDNIQASSPNAASPVIYGNQSTSSRGTANWSTQFANLNKSPLPTNSTTTLNKDLRTPRTAQWNLMLEQALPGASTLTVGYAGSRGLHLYGLEFLNPIVNSAGTRLYTNRGNIGSFSTSGDSWYHGLQTEFTHRRGNLYFKTAYTWSKAMDDVSDPYTSGNLSGYPQIESALGGKRGLDWGPSAYDKRHRVVFSTVYSPKTWHAQGFNKVLASMVNGFTFGAIVGLQSGSTTNPLVGIDMNNDGVGNDRPVLANALAPYNSFAVKATDFYPAARGGVSGAYCDGSYVLNGLSKNPVTGANDQYCHLVSLSQVHWYAGDRYQQSVTASRNTGRTQGIITQDANVERSFRITERAAFSFRAEAYNLLNHANVGGQNGTLLPSFTLYSAANQPVAPGYTLNTFANYDTVHGGYRNLRFYGKISF